MTLSSAVLLFISVLSGTSFTRAQMFGSCPAGPKLIKVHQYPWLMRQHMVMFSLFFQLLGGTNLCAFATRNVVPPLLTRISVEKRMGQEITLVPSNKEFLNAVASPRLHTSFYVGAAGCTG